MKQNKTVLTLASVDDFLAAIEDPLRRADSIAVRQLFEELVSESPHMYGTSIVGFGSSMTKYADGHEEPWPLVAFAPRKANITLYVSRLQEFGEILQRLGKHKASGGCLHLKRLSDVDPVVLKELISASLERRKLINNSEN